MDKGGSGDYEVGWGKPPKTGQYQEGQAGNPNGRPRGAKNLKTIVKRELFEKITIKEGGKTKKVTKLEGIVKALSNSALHGKLGAIAKLFELLERLQQNDGEAQDSTAMSEADKDLFDEFLIELAKDKLRPGDGGVQS